MTRGTRLLFWALTLLSVVPLWCARYLPFTDLPEHVAAMATISHLIAGQSPDAAIYEIAFGRCQYLLYHGLGALFTLVVGDAVIANKLLLSAVALAFPLSLRAALRAFAKDEALALLAVLPFLARPLFIGFLPYVASIPLYFCGVALVERHRAAPSLRRKIGLAVFPLLLLFTHASAAVLFLASAFALETLAAARSVETISAWARAALRSCVWLIPGCAAVAGWWAFGKITVQADSLAGPGEIGSLGLIHSLRALPLWSFDLFTTHLDELCGVAWWGTLAAFALAGSRPARPGARSGILGLVARIDLALVPLLVLLAAFLFTPFRVGAGGMLNVRLAPLIALAATLPLARVDVRVRWWLLGAVAMTTVVHVANAAWAIRTLAAREVAGLDEVLGAMRPGTSVVSLQFDPRRSLAHVDPYPFVASYHRARGGGIASYSFSDLVHWPVQYRSGMAPPTKPGLWIYHPCSYRNAVDGPHYDYVLVGGEVEPFRLAPEGPAWRLIKTAGAYSLYERDGTTRWTGPDLGPCKRDP